MVVDNSQRLRHTIQVAFVVLNAWLGIQFYLWVRSSSAAASASKFRVPQAPKAGCPLPD